MSYKFDPENPFKAERPSRETPVGTCESKGLRIEHCFSTPGVHPFDQLEWEKRSAKITSDSGDTVFEVVRFEATTTDGKRKKRFVQRHRDADGKIVNGVDGIAKVPYRLPEFLEDVAQERAIFFVEGEKCADAARKLGVPATTNPMGAG